MNVTVQVGMTSKEEISAPQSSRRPSATTSLYRVIWRWHFYAGLIVSPVLMIVAITGALYTFRSEIEDYAHAERRFVSPPASASRLDARVQLDAARAVHPGRASSSVELFADPSRASIVRFGDRGGKDATIVHVDPYRGCVISLESQIKPDGLETFFGTVLTLHRQLFLGSTGRIVVELTAGWSIILLLSGLYLWWPKKITQRRGVWWPRFRAKPYTILRDLHSVAGFYLLLPALVITITGLFYSLVWSEAFYFVTHLGPTVGVAKTKETPAKRTTSAILSVDRIELIARSLYPDRNVEINLPREQEGNFIVRAGNDFNKSYGEFVTTQLTLDALDGTVLARESLAENERFWWHGWVYPLHVGSIYGTTTKVIWFIASLVLAGLPITGLWMWLVRRPAGKSGFPRRPDRSIPLALIVGITVLAIALPVVGISILLILIGEFAVATLVNRSARSA